MNRNACYILALVLLVWIVGCSSHSSDDQSSEVQAEQKSSVKTAELTASTPEEFAQSIVTLLAANDSNEFARFAYLPKKELLAFQKKVVPADRLEELTERIQAYFNRQQEINKECFAEVRNELAKDGCDWNQAQFVGAEYEIIKEKEFSGSKSVTVSLSAGAQTYKFVMRDCILINDRWFTLEEIHAATKERAHAPKPKAEQIDHGLHDHGEAERKSSPRQPRDEKVDQKQKLKKLSAEEVADLLADEIGRWKITGKNMPAGGDVEPFEDTMETRWKVKDKSIAVTFSPLINGKRVPFAGDKQYDPQAGVFIWRRKGEGLPEIVSREQYDPATKAYRAESTYPDGAKETTTFKRVSKTKSLFSSQVELDGKIVFSREAIFTRLPDSEDKAEQSDHDHGEAKRKNSLEQPAAEKIVGELPSTPEAAVKHALELISAGDITTFLTTYMPPEALQKEVDRVGSLKQLAAKLEPFVNRVIKVALLEMDRKPPVYSTDGKTATYKIYNVSEFDEAVFKKIGSRWYLEP